MGRKIIEGGAEVALELDVQTPQIQHCRVMLVHRIVYDIVRF
jgi:hypothetical protein